MQQNEEMLPASTEQPTQKKYQTLLIDPPWNVYQTDVWGAVKHAESLSLHLPALQAKVPKPWQPNLEILQPGVRLFSQEPAKRTVKKVLPLCCQ